MKFITKFKDFPGGPVVKNPPANAGHMNLISDPGDPTCLRATKPWALTTELALLIKIFDLFIKYLDTFYLLNIVLLAKNTDWMERQSSCLHRNHRLEEDTVSLTISAMMNVIF